MHGRPSVTNLRPVRVSTDVVDAPKKVAVGVPQDVLPDDMQTWTPDHVLQFVSTIPRCDEYTSSFESEQVCGK